MLQNIKLHMHPDADVQSANEKRAVEGMIRQKNENFAFFRTMMPNVASLISEEREASYSIFCNRHEELNIVDTANGSVVYGQHPKDEALAQVTIFLKTPQYVSMSGRLSSSTEPQPDLLEGLSSPMAEVLRQASPLDDKSAVVVMLGVGLGYQIDALIKSCDVAHLIIYEPNLDFFDCSLLAVSWRETFRLARDHNTAIYLQLGKDGSDIYNDISELADNVAMDGFYLYRHYHYTVFDRIVSSLASTRWQHSELPTLPLTTSVTTDDYVPICAPIVDLNDWKRRNLDQNRFRKNIAAFKHYFPDIHDNFADYIPTKWFPLGNSAGEVNVFHHETLAPLYSSTPSEDGMAIFSSYEAHPHRSRVSIPPTKGKFQRYDHFRFAKEVVSGLASIEDSEGRLPEEIETLIIFEFGCGYQLAPLVSRDIKMLFLCEPNRDFFYASLYAFDWAGLLTSMDEREGRVYINIGDDGTQLAKDLLSRFSALGVHLLSNAYFYRGGDNQWLNPAMERLHEQLQLIIAMQGNFDHSLYIMTQTRLAVENHAAFLMQDAEQKLSVKHKEVPVFLVGNGPSLDTLMPTLKENADKAIIISCGTALQSLYYNGIVPDFHAEVEVNRSTCDWVGRIDDPGYLKKIRLVSWSAIHPDLVAKFGASYLVFKSGEAPTVAADTMYSGFPLVSLRNAHPTVSNLAADFIAQFGFQECYLFGTDLGFVDDKYHHSKNSGYYLDKGKELLELSKVNNTRIQVEGNFRPTVFTKSEFRLSASVLGAVFAKSAGAVYNLNDGAKIQGTSPLHPEHVLIFSTAEQKSDALRALTNRCFVHFIPYDYKRRMQLHYSREKLLHDFKVFIATTKEIHEPEALIAMNREMIDRARAEGGSLFLLLMKGSVELMNCALNKLRVVLDDAVREKALTKVWNAWEHFLAQAQARLEKDYNAVDFVGNFVALRKAVFFKQWREQTAIDQFQIVPATNTRYLKNIDLFKLATDFGTRPPDTLSKKICFYDSQSQNLERDTACYIVTEETSLEFLRKHVDAPIVFAPGNYEKKEFSPSCNPIDRLRCASEVVVNEYKNIIALPKLTLDSVHQKVSDHYDLSWVSDFYIYDCTTYLILSEQRIADDSRVNRLGDRLRYIPILMPEDLIQKELTLEDQRVDKNLVREVMVSGALNV